MRLSQHDLDAVVRPQVYRRRDLEIDSPPDVVNQVMAEQPETFDGRAVREIETLDGIKLRFRDGWLLFRASGTEPILRMYCEMVSTEECHAVLDAAESYAQRQLGSKPVWR
ncbi:hypothetical protein ACFLSF_01630 [Candidatus Bipolaricaulota bacterium]